MNKLDETVSVDHTVYAPETESKSSPSLHGRTLSESSPSSSNPSPILISCNISPLRNSSTTPPSSPISDTSSTGVNPSTSGTCRKLPCRPLALSDGAFLTDAGRWPGPTVRALELLQQEQFRRDILLPDVASRLINEGLEAITAGVKQ